MTNRLLFFGLLLLITACNKDTAQNKETESKSSDNTKENIQSVTQKSSLQENDIDNFPKLWLKLTWINNEYVNFIPCYTGNGSVEIRKQEEEYLIVFHIGEDSDKYKILSFDKISENTYKIKIGQGEYDESEHLLTVSIENNKASWKGMSYLDEGTFVADADKGNYKTIEENCNEAGMSDKEKTTRENPKDIYDYFLILPDQDLYSYGEGKNSFEAKEIYITDRAGKEITIDRPNAYLKIVDNTEELESSIEMTYFTKKDGNKIIAANYYQAGGDCDNHVLKFYTYNNKTWTEITEAVLPALNLAELWDPRDLPQEKFRQAELEYLLPQKGTSITLNILSLCEQRWFDEKDRWDTYYEHYKKIKTNKLTLLYNKETGKFSFKK